ncbi:MAG: glycoside hydrolase family 3 C-terminal domain-containing protein [Clostridia bacterium]|nr:glycoside hydrolase family 3 C-terminal domain-containing protein [Clostridia bacterium]
MEENGQIRMRDGREFINELLAKMDLEEKIVQLGSVWSHELLDEKNFSYDKAYKLISKGIGQVTRPASTTGLSPREVAEFVNAVQEFLVEHTRLGIPALIHEECLAGYPGKGGTCFPQPIGLASSWEPSLVKRVTKVIREQLRSVGIHQGLAPVLDLARDPRWGRVEETFGEDPLLTAVMGVAYIRGLQGEDLKSGVVATAKHYIAYGVPEGGLNCAPAHVGERELLETFALPFEAAVRLANVQSVMPSYNEIDGVPCTANGELINTLLRAKWGFKGLVVSDYRAIDLLRTYHKSAPTKEDAALYAIIAGVDVELPQTDCYGKPLLQLVRMGKLSEELIDKAVRRVLLTKYLVGLFDAPYVDVNRSEYLFMSQEVRNLALEAALKSIVLLKNDGILPLQKNQRIALVGSCAFGPRYLLGDYSGIAIAERMCLIDNKFEEVRQMMDVEMQKKVPTVAEAIGKKLRIVDINEADIVVVVVGDKSGFTPECTCGETRDSATLKLPYQQEKIILNMCSKNIPVILILIIGRPYDISNVTDKVSAIIQCWKPGEKGAEAIAQVLVGEYTPQGRLPITFPRSVGQIPNQYRKKPSAGKSYWWEKYIDEDVTPQFSFGHGLSYTKFEYSGFDVQPRVVSPDDNINIQLYVTNSGKYPATEIVQLYTQSKGMFITRPVLELQGFIAVKANPGETKMVKFQLPCSSLAFYDEHKNLMVKAGKYRVMIGRSAEDIIYSSEIYISRNKKLKNKNLNNVKYCAY